MANDEISRREFILGAVAAGMTMAAAETLWPRVLAAAPSHGGHLTVSINSGRTSELISKQLT